MENFEKLGVFYLGRLYDLAKKESRDGLLLYDSKDLVTHATCVGMTGSGKTGLCIGLIEEAALDGVPAILIDPKGDLGNLLLTFPKLEGKDFLPWVNPDDARKKEMSLEEYADKQAELWKNGIAQWGQDGERIQRLRDAADFTIYTPGSSAGLQVSILNSFSSPEKEVLEDEDLLGDRISSTVTSLLGLVGIDADPIQSREHILLSTILDHAWRQGRDLDLAALIEQVQNPPVKKVGVLDLESFYPSKDRFGLVMALNNVLASPGFSAWVEGQPLDIDNILYTSDGKPRVAIFSIAHLSDAERMFFVSLLLNQVLGWMRSQPGTTSLRAILYIDEIFGYLPPVGNPPSKMPLLTLLKQARAFGLGVVLATQNPVDLDYKALSNTGTWFIGRLQTERDKARLLDGLEGVAGTAGASFDRGAIEKIISSLGKRVFLLNNVHEDAPEVFETRWVMSYLRGPLTRDHIKQLMEPVKKSTPSEADETSPAASAKPATQQPATVEAETAAGRPPVLAGDVDMYYIPVHGTAEQGETLIYQPGVLGAADVRFADKKLNVDVTQEKVFFAPVTDKAIAVDWDKGQEAAVPVSELETSPQQDALFAELPAPAGQSKSYTGWKREYSSWLVANQSLELLKSPSLGEVALPGETERSFRIRLRQVAREYRDEEKDKLREKYADKIEKLEERIRKAEQRVEKERTQARSQQLDTAISVGSTLLGAFTGRKTGSKVRSAARSFGRASEQTRDVAHAKEVVEKYQQDIEDLNAELEEEIAELEDRIDPRTEKLETVTIKPLKTYVSVQLLALVWQPYWSDARGNLTPAWE